MLMGLSERPVEGLPGAKLSCCGIGFQETKAYAMHVEIAHGPERLTCCGTSFKGVAEFSQHLKSRHGAR